MTDSSEKHKLISTKLMTRQNICQREKEDREREREKKYKYHYNIMEVCCVASRTLNFDRCLNL
jgi:hypothetical protein